MCPYEEKLTAWLLGDLSSEDAHEMALHLETCASCRSVRDELSHVLKPLRSGLEKDRALGLVRPRNPAPLRAFFALWLTPQAGLKRVAALALFLGALVALIGVTYVGSRHAAPGADVTYVSFLKPNEVPPPTLAPAEEVRETRIGVPLSDESSHHAEQLVNRSDVIALPGIPAREPVPMSREWGIVDKTIRLPSRGVLVRTPAPSAERSSAYSARDRAEAAKSKHAKVVASASSHPAAAVLVAKPIALAWASSAVTNTPATNAVVPGVVTPVP